MKVALIGDVHANLPALEAVLADAHQRGVEAIWNVGDIVGYGAFPDQVLQRLRQENVLSIVGNYDIKVLEVKKKKDKWKKSQIPEKCSEASPTPKAYGSQGSPTPKAYGSETSPTTSSYGFAFNWAYDKLSKQSRKYLRSLPEEIRLEEEGKRILLTHGSPTSNEEHIASDTPEERLRELAEMADADVIICGHSHQPFKQKVDDVWFINTGSVGRPDDGDPRACYAILDIIKSRQVGIYHHRIKYDVERAAAAIRENGLPEAFAQMVLQGRALDAVLETSEEAESEAEEAGDSVVAEPEFTDDRSGLSVSSPTEEQSDNSEPETAEAEAEEVAAVSDSTVSDDEALLASVLELAKVCEYEEGHTHQVTRLALLLFDELQPLHCLGAKERFWLHCGALLHDIGWIEGWKGHHKTALRTIQDTTLLPFDNRERLIIGSIARYHRRALPNKKHSHFAALESSEREIVKVLAGILRVADGLDRTHQSLVEDLSCEVKPKKIIVQCSVRCPAEEDRQTALKKGKLLEKVFNRKLVIECQQSGFGDAEFQV